MRLLRDRENELHEEKQKTQVNKSNLGCRFGPVFDSGHVSYSYLNATIGSTCVARRAGKKAATELAPPRISQARSHEARP